MWSMVEFHIFGSIHGIAEIHGVLFSVKSFGVEECEISFPFIDGVKERGGRQLKFFRRKKSQLVFTKKKKKIPQQTLY